MDKTTCEKIGHDDCSCGTVWPTRLKTMQERVAEFHERFGFKVNRPLTECADLDSNRDLRVLGSELRDWAKKFQPKAEQEQEAGDERLYRAHLIVEEAGEVLQSLGLQDEVLLADAIADLLYVVVGTAVTFNIPVEAVFDEVHRSNMTKSRDPNDRRMRRKDPKAGYVKPDIPAAIARGRTV